MKDLQKIINSSFRIIEFSNQPSIFPDDVINANKYLQILKNKNSRDFGINTIVLAAENFKSALIKNSCDLIILNLSEIRELKAVQNTFSAIYTFQRLTLFNLVFNLYFLAKSFVSRQRKFYGFYYAKKGSKVFTYLGFKKKNLPGVRTRHHFSPLIKIEDLFKELNQQKINYCVLRWFDELPAIKMGEDVDLLVDDDDLDKLHGIIDDRPGIVPFDIYSKTGKPGSDFQSLPYYIRSLADKTLEETVCYNDVFRVPSMENYFYLLAYHAVFHKGEKSGLQSEKFNLDNKVNPDHDYLVHLKSIASHTELKVSDFTLEGLHSLLESKGYAPPIDTLYKLSVDNQYLKAFLKENLDKSLEIKKYEGLVCFIAREKIIENGLLDDLLKYIQKEGFTILNVKKLEGEFKENFSKQVRGGNWNQGPWPVSGGLPSVIVVALDVYPVEPKPTDYKLHPGLTNRRIINKNQIRDWINKSLPNESDWFNGIHSSDNEIQALEYLSLAGIYEDEIYEELSKHKQHFITKYPVLEILSRYSKRAKIELIIFNDSKAVKKTFKPMCENFLENEITVYNLFQDILPIPKLLEKGDNYFITSYIDSSRPLGRRINIKQLKICLKILHKLYDAGYSLLDFQPANFLFDNKKNIYLIDFEFLYKYENKPEFLECYDLTGVPEEIDRYLTPNNNIPKGVNQFDALWYDFTGVHYEELSQLDSITLKVKSFIRYYSLRTKYLLFRILRVAKMVTKKISRYLP